jgi:hypothetical protein
VRTPRDRRDMRPGSGTLSREERYNEHHDPRCST